MFTGGMRTLCSIEYKEPELVEDQADSFWPNGAIGKLPRLVNTWLSESILIKKSFIYDCLASLCDDGLSARKKTMSEVSEVELLVELEVELESKVKIGNPL